MGRNEKGLGWPRGHPMSDYLLIAKVIRIEFEI